MLVTKYISVRNEKISMTLSSHIGEIGNHVTANTVLKRWLDFLCHRPTRILDLTPSQFSVECRILLEIKNIIDSLDSYNAEEQQKKIASILESLSLIFFNDKYNFNFRQRESITDPIINPIYHLHVSALNLLNALIIKQGVEPKKAATDLLLKVIDHYTWHNVPSATCLNEALSKAYFIYFHVVPVEVSRIILAHLQNVAEQFDIDGPVPFFLHKDYVFLAMLTSNLYHLRHRLKVLSGYDGNAIDRVFDFNMYLLCGMAKDDPANHSVIVSGYREALVTAREVFGRIAERQY
ncbi:MAG: hypothetical protein DKM50_08815 [Candidatus Margulisiibacteriota bacterium]|nr:MAG: hypothetical protein A2X43_04395 [Candidatus Margulisbacteria bacterium GWD2_39_127]OGI04051.1 MAG: hypothetical protein A2X42_11105 [Candidatus Margulisbacteria bacterium GWF2_38_17]PZM79551.1 MAG: hypothetical protein DKM50_08815 [Candidatus Margulisiibacteriota bacterium]HAR63398.1 hypothetical protein [Candidatus Margulisiibacteriota bacterium]HCY36663.1 hypothetical protein [Candidatus Margulisiibacteriota bacterium]